MLPCSYTRTIVLHYAQVNGMGIADTDQAVKYVTEGNRPIVMEFVTYRYGGHSYVLCPIGLILDTHIS